MLVKIDSENLVKLLKPSLSWGEASLIAEVIGDKFEYIDEPDIEDIAEFIDSITLVKKKDNAEEYGAIEILYRNGLTEDLRATRFDCIYAIDFESETAICGIYY